MSYSILNENLWIMCKIMCSYRCQSHLGKGFRLWIIRVCRACGSGLRLFEIIGVQARKGGLDYRRPHKPAISCCNVASWTQAVDLKTPYYMYRASCYDFPIQYTNVYIYILIICVLISVDILKPKPWTGRHIWQIGSNPYINCRFEIRTPVKRPKNQAQNL